jgi:type VI protein secretion system component VasK
VTPGHPDGQDGRTVKTQEVTYLFVASDYPFLDVFWTMLIFFLWVIWIWFLIIILTDVFRRHDIGGGKKAVWCIFIIFLPFVGALCYLIVNGQGMSERSAKETKQAQSQMDDYIRSAAGSGGAAGEIERAKQLLDSGAIDDQEYAALKAKALAGGTA